MGALALALPFKPNDILVLVVGRTKAGYRGHHFVILFDFLRSWVKPSQLVVRRQETRKLALILDLRMIFLTLKTAF